MAKKLSVKIQPAAARPGATLLKQLLFARLTYTREITSEEPVTGTNTSSNIPGSRRVELGKDGEAGLEVQDHAEGTPFTVHVESSQGTVLWASEEQDGGNGDVETTVAVPDTLFDVDVNFPAAAANLTRVGRFVRLDDAMPDFALHRLFVAPIRPVEFDGRKNPQTASVRDLLGLGGQQEVTSFEVTRLDTRKIKPELLNAVGLQPATLRPDGAFDFSVDIEGDEIAWLWLLLGPEDFAGYQLDALPSRPRPPVIIMLPVNPDGGPDGASGAEGGGNDDVPGEARGRSTLDFDERQLIGHPDAFADDPGSSCSPFRNPQRVLGERRFFTVLRMDQPEIGGNASLKVSRPIVLDLAPPIRLSSIVASSRAERAGDLPLSNINAARFNLAAVSQPRLDFRKALDLSVFRPSRLPWQQWIRERSRNREPVSESNPIEWDGDPTIYQACSVVGGHVLEWRVQWRSNGYSLGNVAHTLTLAPRQTRRITRVSWRRRELARREERTDAADALTQVTSRARDYTDAVQSSLSEWSAGGSKSRATGVAGGIGFAMGPVVIGGGAAHGQASSESWQQGGRRVAAAEQQQLRDAIRQYGESVRSAENTIVSEIAQEEESEGVSETLRNVNYCHALSVIYYEILRHLRVDTEFAGVRECLFVPFSVTPFDLDKALKWRDKLRHGMIDRSLRWALDRLDEVASAWADSDIPPGPRMQHPVDYISGSIYIQLSVDRPREQNEDEPFEDYVRVWTPLASIMAVPARRVIGDLKATVERARDTYFQREVAPSMAARWADNLQLQVGSATVGGVDFTLATGYRFGGVVRIDFTAPINGAFTREQMQQITVRAGAALPAGSVANLQRMTLRYHTRHFDRQVQSDSGVRDIVTVETGLPDAAGAVAHLPTSSWEREDLREMIENAVEKLIVHLNANLVYYHKVIWWLMDRDELYMMLDGFSAPYGRRFDNGQWVEDPGRSLASVVERDPMAILGNTLVFRVAAGAFMGVNGHRSPQDAYRYYQDSQVRGEPMRISLPTEGLYAQALMDECNACEEHAGSVDWVLNDKDPELELVAGQLGTRRTEPEGLTPTPLSAPIITLQNAPNAPDPQGLGGVLGAVTNAGAFRDMAGLAGTQANAAAAMTTAASLASTFGNQAAALELQRRQQAAAELDKQRASLERSVNSGIMKKEDAEKHLNKLHEAATGSPGSDAAPRTSDELVTKVAAGLRPGQSGTVSRTTPEGVETVSVDSSELLATTNWSHVPQHCGFPAENRVVPEAELRNSIRMEAEGERNAWINSADDRIRGEDDDAIFGRLVMMWVSINVAIAPDVLAALQVAALDPARDYGDILDPGAAAAAVNADIQRVRTELLGAVPPPINPAPLRTIIEEALRRARWSREDHPDYAFWSAAYISTVVRRAGIAATIERVGPGGHVGQNEILEAGMAHRTFLQEAYRRRFGPSGMRQGTYHAFEAGEREPQVGDIIVQDRTANSVAGVTSFQRIPTMGARGLHSDIVIEANEGDDFVVTVGGNVGDSVRRRRFPLTADRHLLVQPTALYTTEDASQNLPALGATSSAALASDSTARVFALLSPTETCIVLPGTRVDGNVIV